MFSIDPNFRAWTQGTQRLLWNAIVGRPRRGAAAAPLAGSRQRAAAEKAAADGRCGDPEPRVGDPHPGRRGRCRGTRSKVLRRHGAEVVRLDVDGDALFLVANRKDLSYDEHPTFPLIVRDLERAGVTIRAASLP